MLRKLRRSRLTPWLAWVAVGTTGAGPLIPAQASPSKPSSRYELPGQRTQRLPEQERRALGKDAPPVPDVRALSLAEMERLRGAGYRDERLAGTMPWHRSFRDVNLCTGNLFKNFTDIQVAPARGAGLVLNRSYNSLDPRCGPFGIGWTHAYDIHMKEDVPDPDGTEYAIRKDFFGGAHRYRRDADGLYTPPPYLYDELSSEYDATLINGGPISDTDVSLDGTVKHFFKNGDERSCDWIEDRHGNRTTLTYGGEVEIGGVLKKLLASVTDPSGRTIEFTWNDVAPGVYRIVAASATGGQSVSYGYDATGLLISVTLDPGGLNRTTTYAYDTVCGEVGLLATITDPLGNDLNFTFALSGQYSEPNVLWVSQVREPAGMDGLTRRYTSWLITPGPWTSNGPFDSLYRTSGVSSAGLGLTLYMDASLRKRAYGVGPPECPPVTYLHVTDYDGANNVTRTQTVYFQPVGDYNRVDRYEYGQHGNVTTHWVEGFGLQAGSQQKEVTVYYNASQYFQKASVTDMLGRTTVFGVGDRTGADPSDPSRPASSGNRGNVLWVKDARFAQTGEKYEYWYDGYGRKTSETNLNNVVTQYAYGDAWGNLTQVTQDAGGLSRLTSMTYDASGRVLSSTDPNGLTTAFIYNALGQLERADYPATQDTPAETVRYFYDANGRMVRVQDARGESVLEYEPNSDRLVRATDPVTGDVSYSYRPDGARATMGLPGGGSWTYEYVGDNMGVLPKDDPNALSPRLLRVVDHLQQPVELDRGAYISYNGFLGIPTTVWYNQVFQGTTRVQYCETRYEYDRSSQPNSGSRSHGWLAQITNRLWWRDGQGQWQSRVLTQNDYAYDGAGMRTSNTVCIDGQNARAEQYGYDELYRLTAVDYGDGVTQGYTFDNMGNRLTKTEGGTTETYGYNAANMLVSRNGQAYVNDANGNTLSGGGRLNTWDSQNRLVKCVSGSNTSLFTYGSDGLRRTSVVNGTTTHYALDNGMLVREFTATLQPTATYLPGPRGVEYRRNDATGQTMWYLYDGLGSVLAEIDPLGNMTTPRKYDVYGLFRAGDSGTSRHKFVGSLGHTSEDETGFIYMRARWMDPSLGRFISEDPRAHGSNWFAYGGSNPVNKLDTNGKEDYWNWEFQMWRTEWRYALHHAPEFRLVAAAFLAGWWGLFAAEALGGGVGDQINSMLSLNILTSDAAGAAGRPPSPVPPSERVKAFYAGYSACLSLTFMFLFPGEFQTSGPLDPTRWL